MPRRPTQADPEDASHRADEQADDEAYARTVEEWRRFVGETGYEFDSVDERYQPREMSERRSDEPEGE